MVLSEAGASGMAIIATNVAAIRAILRNGETGLMVPAGAAAALTQALWDLATNPAFRSVLGEHAMAHVSRHYDAPTNASRLLGLLKAEANAVRAEKLAAPRARFRVVPTRRAEKWGMRPQTHSINCQGDVTSVAHKEKKTTSPAAWARFRRVLDPTR